LISKKLVKQVKVLNMKKIAYTAAVAAFVASAAPSAFAAQVSDAFDVKIKVNAVCLVVANDVNFGTVTEVLGTETATGTVAVRCSKSTPFTLSFAAASAATTASGNMAGVTAGNTDTVPYALTMSGSSGTGAGLAAASAQNFTINGSITAAVPALKPDDYLAARTLYVNY
jgi:spore coat protein U-like protein